MKQPKPPTTVLSVRVPQDLADRVPKPVQWYLMRLIVKDQVNTKNTGHSLQPDKEG